MIFYGKRNTIEYHQLQGRDKMNFFNFLNHITVIERAFYLLFSKSKGLKLARTCNELRHILRKFITGYRTDQNSGNKKMRMYGSYFKLSMVFYHNFKLLHHIPSFILHNISNFNFNFLFSELLESPTEDNHLR
jgi:hypothetical protein